MSDKKPIHYSPLLKRTDSNNGLCDKDPHKYDYYYSANRKAVMHGFSERTIDLIKVQDDMKTYLHDEIINKIFKLYAQIISAKGLDRFQKSKRHDKIMALIDLLTLIATDQEISDFSVRFTQRFRTVLFVASQDKLHAKGIKTISDLKTQKYYKNALFSFFKKTGDVKDIFDAAEEYLKTGPEIKFNL